MTVRSSNFLTETAISFFQFKKDLWWNSPFECTIVHELPFPLCGQPNKTEFQAIVPIMSQWIYRNYFWFHNLPRREAQTYLSLVGATKNWHDATSFQWEKDWDTSWYEMGFKFSYPCASRLTYNGSFWTCTSDFTITSLRKEEGRLQ